MDCIDMCVCNIWIVCKMSTDFSRGQSHVCSWLPIEEGCIHDWYDSGTVESRTCQTNNILFSRWDVANPRTTVPSFLHFVFAAYWGNSCRAYAIWAPFRTEHTELQNWELGMRRTNVLNSFFHPSWTDSCCFTDPTNSVLLLVLLHDRYTPQQNSQWQFLASVCRLYDAWMRILIPQHPPALLAAELSWVKIMSCLGVRLVFVSFPACSTCSYESVIPMGAAFCFNMQETCSIKAVALVQGPDLSSWNPFAKKDKEKKTSETWQCIEFCSEVLTALT